MFNQLNGFNTLLLPDAPAYYFLGLSDMIAQIQLRLGKRTDLVDEITREIKVAQYDLERDVTFNPYFLWKAADLVVSEEVLDYDVPANFIRLCEFNNPLFHPEDCPTAYELNRGIGAVTHPVNVPLSAPTAFSLQANTIRLNKRTNGILRIFFQAKTTPLATGTPNNQWTEQAYNLLLNKAGLAMAGIIRDQDGVALFGAGYATSLVAFKKECVAYEDYGYDLARAEGLYAGLIKDVGGWYPAA